MRKNETEKHWQDKTASWIAQKIIAAQLFISHYLEKQERRLTIKQKKIALFIFCLSCGGYLLYLLGSALFYRPTLHPLHGISPVLGNAHPPPDTSSSDKRTKNVQVSTKAKTMKAYSEKFKKQRKFLMVAPLLVLPFITMIFWALGGGQGTQALPDKKQQKGFNMKLPQAKLPAGNLDKMSLYHIAEQDSQALREARAQDPYADYENTQANLYPEDTNKPGYKLYRSGYNDSYGGGTSLQSNPDPNEVKVGRKLAQLETALNATPDTDLYSTNDLPMAEDGKDGNAATSRLQQLLANDQPEDSPDPELQQLNGMLEKILDIQHPGRLQEKLKEQSEKQAGRVFPVTTANNTGTASLLWRPFIPDLPDDSALRLWNELQQNAFYDLTQPAIENDVFGRQAIPAVVHGTQTLVSGATVKLRLLKDVFIDGTRVPRNTFVFGTCTVTGGRLDIQVKDIRYGNHIFPVSLNVFDMDGLEGIRVPGAITRDAAKEGADQTIQSLQFMNMNPSLATQAAGAGIETIKGLLGKKTKLVRVTVKAGYPVLLVDQKALQEQ